MKDEQVHYIFIATACHTIWNIEGSADRLTLDQHFHKQSEHILFLASYLKRNKLSSQMFS